MPRANVRRSGVLNQIEKATQTIPLPSTS